MKNDRFRGNSYSRIAFLGILLLGGMTTAFGQTNSVYGGTWTNWPVNWTPIQSLNDPNDGVSQQQFELVGNSNNPCFYYGVDQNYFYARVRVAAATPGTNLWGGSILIAVDQQGLGTDTDPDYAFGWDYKSTDQNNHGVELMIPGVNGSDWKTTDFDDIDGNNAKKIAPPDFGLTNGDAYARILQNQPTTNFSNTTLIDFAFSWRHLTNYTNLRPDQYWRLQVGTVINATDHGWIDTDVAANSFPTNSPRTWGNYVYVTAVPEPSTWLLIILAAIFIGAANFRHKLRPDKAS